MTENFVQRCLEIAKKAVEGQHPDLGTFSTVYRYFSIIFVGFLKKIMINLASFEAF